MYAANSRVESLAPVFVLQKCREGQMSVGQMVFDRKTRSLIYGQTVDARITLQVKLVCS
jgi:hypothetical protein